jgi:hypothetical protein
MVKITSVGPSPQIAGVLMTSDDKVDRFYEAEIGAADLRIQNLLGTVKQLEKAGHYRAANKSRELLALITESQECRRLRHERMQAIMHLSHGQ